MKRNARLILSMIERRQRVPIRVDDLSRLAFLCPRATARYLRLLEQAQYLTVDRSERPHAYEITAKGYAALDKEQTRASLV